MKSGSAVIASAFGRGSRFAAQVKLARGPPLEGLNHQPGLQAAQFAAHRLKMGGCPFISVDRAREFFLNAGAQHFDGHRHPLGRNSAVDLRDGGGAHRLGVDRRKQAAQRLAKRSRHCLFNRRKGQRGHRILQPNQIAGGILANDIGAGCKRLTEFDRGRADCLQRIGIGRYGRRARAKAGDPAQPPHRRRRVWIALDPAQSAVACQRARPFQQAPKMRCGCGHGVWRALKSSSRCGSRQGRRAWVRRGCW